MTIKEIVQLTGLSPRTLHHYDEIGLLRPHRNPENNYRSYTAEDVTRLQQILLLRECGFPLEDIQQLLDRPNFSHEKAFENQKNWLEKEIKRLKQMIRVVDASLLELEKGETYMSNKEKFSPFRQKLVEENDAQYGAEIREKYGAETIEASNKNFLNMPEAVFAQSQKLEGEILQLLKEENLSPDQRKDLAQKHKEWLSIMWTDSVAYSKDAHLALVDMYGVDERFSAYYGGLEKVAVLKEAVQQYL